MLPKKNPEVEIGRNSGLYFAIGLNIMLLFTYFGLNYKSYEKDVLLADVLQMEQQFEEDIPITNLNTPPPPPPPPAAAAPEIINVVEDVEEVQESIIESTESNQSDKIEEKVVQVDEVEVEEVEEEIDVPFAIVESVPIFPGCEGKSNQDLRACFQSGVLGHVKKNFKYPEVALQLGMHGRVMVSFTVDRDGHVSAIKTRGPDKILEEEARRIISLLPAMEPGKQRGKPVKVTFGLPINFKYVPQ
ncbi:energy transducer TonB [Mangrovimonas futianensis]|uniref:energy transducer TonB n=1 Tax=Mangrovimonas futianensis TaxID=2895523 RepID=UPI001E5232DF|nr:energy transducer TonB [Mangrovimonas futianensis]MCF1420334.1 energy transducer TonB [Mangrovimonas futianensis]